VAHILQARRGRFLTGLNARLPPNHLLAVLAKTERPGWARPFVAGLRQSGGEAQLRSHRYQIALFVEDLMTGTAY
jgi:hypothetical protein